MALGAVAFAYANFGHLFWPIRATSSLLVVDFALRLALGLERSPTGVLARWATRGRRPEWVSVRPKRFAWSLGLAMAAMLAALPNGGVPGPLPRAICLTCLALMWLEAVLGLCLGCQLYRLAVQRGWRRAGQDDVVCADGACDVGGRRR